MADDPQVRMDAERGAHAERLLSDDILMEAFSTIESDYINAWKGTGARDTDARERLWQAYQIVGKVRSHLHTVAQRGSLARKELEEIETMGERRKILGIL